MNTMFYHFSSWIILWFIVYKLNINKDLPNPKLFIMVGIIDNLYLLFVLFSHHNIKYIINNYDKYIELFIHFIIKLLMLFSLSNESIDRNDLSFGLILYIIYNIWLYQTYKLDIIQFYRIKYNFLL